MHIEHLIIRLKNNLPTPLALLAFQGPPNNPNNGSSTKNPFRTVSLVLPFLSFYLNYNIPHWVCAIIVDVQHSPHAHAVVQKRLLLCRYHRKKIRLLFRFHRQMTRSEEHTSELQSRGHLVCRLLLEKKKVHK